MLTRRATLIGAAAALASPAIAQSPDAMDLFYRDARYLPRWLELRDTDDGMAKQYAAFVGDERRALVQASYGQAWGLGADARATPALEAIAAASEGRKVVMLNEAHVASRHRGFLIQVLRRLRPLGFTHFAAEDFLHSLDPNSPSLRNFTPGTPLAPDGGFYRHDPVYAEAIREAAELGYGFIPYEQRNDQDDPADLSELDRIARRETAQAENFAANALAAFPDGRFIVHVGYAHLREFNDAGQSMWFAERLRGLTGLDPLTIEQSTTGSFAPHGTDSALAQAVLARFAPRESIVVQQENQRLLGAASIYADLHVFHPPTPDVEGRPGWLAADPHRRMVRVRERVRGAPDAPVLLQAIPAYEGERAIPSDHVLIERDVRETHLLLRPGRYRLRLEALEGFRQLREIEVS